MNNLWNEFLEIIKTCKKTFQEHALSEKILIVIVAIVSLCIWISILQNDSVDESEIVDSSRAEIEEVQITKLKNHIKKLGLPEELHDICIAEIPDFATLNYIKIEKNGGSAYTIVTEEHGYSCIIAPDGMSVISLYLQGEERKDDVMYYQVIDNEKYGYHLCEYELTSTIEANWDSPTTNYYNCSVCHRSYYEKIGKTKAPIEFRIISYEQDICGGNTIKLSIKNLTNKKIDWIEFSLCFLDIKGETLRDTIRGWETMTWYDGPIRAGQTMEKNIGTFYNYNFKGSAVPIKIIIHYANGEETVAEFFEITEGFDKTLLYYGNKK